MFINQVVASKSAAKNKQRGRQFDMSDLRDFNSKFQVLMEKNKV